MSETASHIVIRQAQPNDAQAMIELFQQLDVESKFMLLEPSERSLSIELQAKKIAEMDSSAIGTMWVAQVGSTLAGFAAGSRGQFIRNKSTLNCIVGVAKVYWKQGLAKRLMTSLEAWAVENQLHRLELTVMTHNDAAIKLYEDRGFVKEGHKRQNLMIDGAYVDEYLMAKLLCSASP